MITTQQYIEYLEDIYFREETLKRLGLTKSDVAMIRQKHIDELKKGN